MRVADDLFLALGVVALLCGGCMSDPAPSGSAGEKPPEPHAGMPLSFSARVVGDKRPDFFNLTTILDLPRFKGKKGAELSSVIGEYFASARDGCTPFGNSEVVERCPLMRTRLIDPLRMINAYGWLTFDPSDHVPTHGESRAHTMDFVLRPGEVLIRSQRNEGRFPLLVAATNGEAQVRYVPLRTCGNGQWIYEPNLTAGYLDFSAGVRERTGIVQTKDGLSGVGGCVIPFVSPYPFVAVADDSGDVRFHDGAWITLCATGSVTLAISDSTGNWITLPVPASGRMEKIDISSLVESRYAFNIRLTLGATARVSKFRFDGYLLTAPVTLPRLDEGVNVMMLRGRDKYGLMTLPYEIIPDFRKTAAVPLDQQVQIRNGKLRSDGDTWQEIASKGDGPVQAIFTFDAPCGEKFAWFYALVCAADGPAQSPQSKIQMEWRDGHGDFQPLSESVIGNTPSHLDSILGKEQILDQPGGKVQIRVTSDTSIRGLQFVGHLAMGAALYVRPEITHRWLENSTERRFVAPPGADGYYFRCGPNPTGHSIEMALPSYRDLPKFSIRNSEY